MNFLKSTRYMEEWARHTLHHICAFSMDELECKDKPDIQSKAGNVGIEVVRDVYADELERQRFAETIWGKAYDDVDKGKVQRFERGGGFITVKDGDIQEIAYGEKPSNPSHLIKTIEKKVELLNQGGYKVFEAYGLYVFVDTTFIDKYFKSFVQQTIESVVAFQKDQMVKYDVLYLDQWYTMCVCDLVKGEFTHYPISRETQKRIHDEVNCICHD